MNKRRRQFFSPGSFSRSSFSRSSGVAVLALLLCACQTAPAPEAARGPPHNVIIFVADGLRYGSVTETNGPAFAALRAYGVDFANSHSVYPTVTTANASALATGHGLGDTGNYANGIYPGDPWLEHGAFNRVIFLEDDQILGDMNGRFGGNYLHEASLLSVARQHGYNVAAIGKTGPAAIQDLGAAERGDGIVIDEATGGPLGLPVPADVTQAIAAAHLADAPPPRNRPNRAQQDWFTSVTTDVLLPHLHADGKPFLMVFWSPDPDNAQHNQTDSPEALTPGINGPTSNAAILNASSDLERIRAALAAQGLEATTDIVVVADHGFSTISKQTQTSHSATLHYRDFPDGQLPPGFLAIDLAHALSMPLFQPNGLDVALEQGLPPRGASAMLGPDFEHPQILIAANGASDLIYIPGDDAASLAPRIVEFLTQQDYVSAIFVADGLGQIPGALPLSAIRLQGDAVTPQPAIVVSFKSVSTGCENPELCSAEIADTSLRQGQGQHGGLNRADTRNFMAAIGPDFRAGFVDPAPVSNADIAPTIAHILGFDLPSAGHLNGRVISEALPRGAPVPFSADTVRSTPAANGFQTLLNRQRAGVAEYYDAAGAPGRAVGLHE